MYISAWRTSYFFAFFYILFNSFCIFPFEEWVILLSVFYIWFNLFCIFPLEETIILLSVGVFGLILFVYFRLKSELYCCGEAISLLFSGSHFWETLRVPQQPQMSCCDLFTLVTWKYTLEESHIDVTDVAMHHLL